MYVCFIIIIIVVVVIVIHLRFLGPRFTFSNCLFQVKLILTMLSSFLFFVFFSVLFIYVPLDSEQVYVNKCINVH
jgi:hypothetical protein